MLTVEFGAMNSVRRKPRHTRGILVVGVKVAWKRGSIVVAQRKFKGTEEKFEGNWINLK
jgi:hypothetical protein